MKPIGNSLPESLKIVYSPNDFDENFDGYLGVLISNVAETDQIRYIVRRIRLNENEKVSLLPIIVHHDFKTLPDSLVNLVDLTIRDLTSQSSQVAELVANIQMALQRMEPVENVDKYEEYIITRALRFIYSRGKKVLSPAITDDGPVGYVHSFITQFMDREYSLDQYNILRMAVKEGYFTSEFVDVIYLCNKCHSGALMYREACTTCNSTNLVQEDIVHHFPCAYVGPQSDFIVAGREQDLICPKCNKRLKHIGVDYDKPSSVFICNQCNQRAQQPTIMVKCCTCLAENSVEHLIKREVLRYHVTAKAMHAAVQGTTLSINKFSDIRGTIPRDVFNLFIAQEVERMKNAKIESYLAKLEFPNIIDLFHKIGNDAQMILLADIVNLIRSNLASSDLVCIENSSTFLVALLDRKHEDAINWISKITIEIRRSLKDNHDDFRAEATFNLKKLMPFKEANDQLRSLVALQEKGS
ncbi:MAG TPA: hypothetical protein VEB86_18575 [Chryseosolibacter sp.]|nr:hypothetical protein [Chryseosolibacter sp.]